MGTTSFAPDSSGDMVSVLQVRNLVKSFGDKRVLDEVSLELFQGECLGLLGPNGAGKTTLVRSIMGRVRPDSGFIRVGAPGAASDGRRPAVAWVPQDLALYPLLSAEENLSVFGRYAGLEGSALHQAIDWGLEWSALREQRRGVVTTFSGGMKRRLNMAAGLLARSPIALLDEPTVGVDPQSRERIYQMIEQLRDEGVSIVYTSHYMEEVERLCARVAIIDGGRVIAVGRQADLIHHEFGSRAELAMRLSGDQGTVATWTKARGGHVEGDVVHFSVEDPAVDTGRLLDAAAESGFSVTHLTMRAPGLQDLFLRLTGNALRE